MSDLLRLVVESSETPATMSAVDQFEDFFLREWAELYSSLCLVTRTVMRRRTSPKTRSSACWTAGIGYSTMEVPRRYLYRTAIERVPELLPPSDKS